MGGRAGVSQIAVIGSAGLRWARGSAFPPASLGRALSVQVQSPSPTVPHLQHFTMSPSSTFFLIFLIEVIYT